jgi:hypothetical protein
MGYLTTGPFKGVELGKVHPRGIRRLEDTVTTANMKLHPHVQATITTVLHQIPIHTLVYDPRSFFPV